MTALTTLRIQIRQRLKQRQATQTALAQYVGRTDGWLSQVLAGKRSVRLPDLDRIAAFFNVTPAALFDDRLSADTIGRDIAQEILHDPAFHAALERLAQDSFKHHLRKRGGR